MATNRYANGARRRRIQERLRHEQRPCALCGRPIDYSIPSLIQLPNGKKIVHPASFVVDEIIPCKYNGSPIQMTNCQPAHAACNSVRGAKSMEWVYGAGRQEIMNALPAALKRCQARINKSVIDHVQSKKAEAKNNSMSSTW